MRILHVDDDEDFRGLFTALIRRPGIEIDGVGTCREAIRRMAKESPSPYDWIVTDYTLPDGNSLSIFSVVRFPGRRILVVTSDASNPVLRREARELGVETLFQKPEGVAMAAAFLLKVFEGRPESPLPPPALPPRPRSEARR